MLWQRTDSESHEGVESMEGRNGSRLTPDRPQRLLLHQRSPVDGVRLPNLVCRISGGAAQHDKPSPLVFVLHDTLKDIDPAAFVEESFLLADHWCEVLDSLGSSLVVFPFGRGNAGWLGAAACDLFSLWEELSGRFSLASQARLVGVGTGATGCLQLAAHYPDRFSHVAALGAWTSKATGATNLTQAPWEETFEQETVPTEWASSLRGVRLWLEHPWWHLGLNGHAGPQHFENLTAALAREQIPFATPTAPRGFDLYSFEERLPSQADELARWLESAEPTANTRASVTRTGITFPRDGLAGVVVERLSVPGQQAELTVATTEEGLDVRTRGIETVRLMATALRTGPVTMDGHTVELPATEAERGSLCFERVGRRWIAADEEGETGSCKSSARPGTLFDFAQSKILIVPGTLGDERENRFARDFAEHLQQRWQSGADSLVPWPVPAQTLRTFPIVQDGQLTNEQLQSHHLVLIGTPRTNLLLARFHGRLACGWDDESASFSFGGHAWDDPSDGIVFLAPTPSTLDRYTLVVSANSLTGYTELANLSLWRIPEYVVFRGKDPSMWGYFGNDWLPIPAPPPRQPSKSSPARTRKGKRS